MHFGVIEYELLGLIIVSVFDIMLTVVDYFSTSKKKRYKTNLSLSIINKLIVVVVCLTADLFTHINDMGLFNNVDYITESVFIGVNLIILLCLKYEIKNALEKFSNITGIDVDDIPFINTTIDKIEKDVSKYETTNIKK